MVLVQLTLLYMILTFVSDNQLDNAKTAKSILPEFHLSETWILAKSCQI